MYQWQMVTFQSGDAVQFHFLKFYFNFRFFLQISQNTASFSVFFKYKIRYLKNKFSDLRPKRILICVSEGRSQKLHLMT